MVFMAASYSRVAVRAAVLHGRTSVTPPLRAGLSKCPAHDVTEMS
jgi:hypothetical protein